MAANSKRDFVPSGKEPESAFIRYVSKGHVSRVVPTNDLNYVAGMYRESVKLSGSVPLLTLIPIEHRCRDLRLSWF